MNNRAQCRFNYYLLSNFPILEASSMSTTEVSAIWGKYVSNSKMVRLLGYYIIEYICWGII